MDGWTDGWKVLGNRRKRRRVITSSDEEGVPVGEADGKPAASCAVRPLEIPRNSLKAVQAAASEPQDVPKAAPAAASEPQDIPKALPAAASERQDLHKAEPAPASEPQDVPKVAEPGASYEEPGLSVRPLAARKPKPKASRARKRSALEASAVPAQEAGDQQDDGQAPTAKADPDNTEQCPVTSRKSPRVGPKKSPDVVKALRAAKRYLTTSGRAEDPIMRARIQVLSELSEEEASAFTEANASRKKGEWCFEVLSPKVEARLQTTEAPSPASQSTGAAGADVAAGPEPSEAPKDTTATEVHSLNQGDASTAKRDVVFETAVHEASTAKPPPPAPSFAERTSVKVPAAPPQPVNSRGRGQSARVRPKAPAASDRKKLDLALSAEVVQGPPLPEGRRRFAPIRPAARPVGVAKPKQAAAPAADAAGGAVTSRPGRARCRHANETRHGPHVICADCGEELRFDAWRLELVDDMDLQSV
ncbi:hypothetical protein AK812_SmicGene17434 [Symbiodinium microadriaticum]|uniref:Uncharacterized protein n=1 Tax=Symbiodinium microadriaticum TaxID=2951 RepID=A0A1Q9DXQ3_SYMMI|nr:hypothetical protein AK812_SmicGene17434 [Symbiodinium microadriaticum]